MLSEIHNTFTKDNLNTYLKELAKEYRKLCGKGMEAEIVLIGGAAVLANYGFRDMTTDVDALIHASSAMKDAITIVENKYGLPHGWLNSDFMHTGSYSQKLLQFSVYYRTFSNVLKVRTVNAEYLVAMKLSSGRQYKNDLSDVIGILAEHQGRGQALTLSQIKKAVADLYGQWEAIPERSRSFVEAALERQDLQQIYDRITSSEKEAKALLIGFEERYPGAMTTENVNEILENLRGKESSKESLLEVLKAKRKVQQEE